MSLQWTDEIFAQAYSHYHRDYWINTANYGYYRTVLTKLISRNDLTPSQKVLLVGCGFGYWIEFLMSQVGMNPDNVWGTDPSPFIQTNKTNDYYCHADIRNKILTVDIASPTITNELKPFFGGNGTVTWVLSTLVLESLQTDQEIADFSASCRNPLSQQGKVGHIFASDLGDASDKSFGMNFQPREYWSDRLPDDWLFDIQNGFHVWSPETKTWSDATNG